MRWPDIPARLPRRRARAALLAAPLGALLASGAGCGGDTSAEGAGATLRSSLESPLELTVDTSARLQRITGFGASSAWTASSISEADADLFFSAERGLGLSLLRVRIAPDGTTMETVTAKRAAARGALVWASPWSPPGAWKTSGTDTNGGSLLPENYQAWADRLSGFAASMAAAGVPLFALSAQNEPNWTADWETCVYAPDELVTFVRDNLGPALARDSPGTKLVAPETIDWTSLAQFADPLLADPDASAALGIVAVHAYGGTPYAYTAPADNGKELWETEVSYDDDETPILTALDTAREIHRHLTDGGVNAFHYWWLVSDTSGSLMSGGTLLPQAYALGHYSKFVRPGYVRLDVPPQPQAGVSSSAYFDPASHRTVIVLVNEASEDIQLSFRVEGVAPVEVEPWVTSATDSLAPRAPIAFNNPFAYVFSAQSITSLVVSETAESQGSGGEGGTPAVVEPGSGEAGSSGEAGAAGTSPSNEGGAPSKASSGGSKSSTGGAPEKLPTPRGGTQNGGSGGTGNAAAHAGGAAVAALRPHKAGAYAGCEIGTRAATSSRASATPLIGLLLFGLRRRRRSGSGSPRG